MFWLVLLAELTVKFSGVLSHSHYEASGMMDDEAKVLKIKTSILGVTLSEGYFDKIIYIIF